jgi:hypothetical protein
MTIATTLNNEDIALGVPCLSTRCPVAIKLKRIFQELDIVCSVQVTALEVFAHFVPPHKSWKPRYMIAITSRELGAWIRNFDGKDITPEPISFKLKFYHSLPQ